MSAGFRRAKIVSTIGPASWDRDVLHDLIEAGTDAVRINFTHTPTDRAAGLVRKISDMARDVGRPVAIIGDLGGPKIRVGDLPGDQLDIEPEGTYWFFPEGEDAPAGSSPAPTDSDHISGAGRGGRARKPDPARRRPLRIRGAGSLR